MRNLRLCLVRTEMCVWGGGGGEWVFAIFANGDSFCNFLFASLKHDATPKRVQLLKERMG